MTLTSEPSAHRSLAPAALRKAKAQKAGRVAGSERLPAEVEFILSALDVGSCPMQARRRAARMSYRVSASLKLYSDRAEGSPWQIFVKDVNPKGLGFLTRHRLPLGYGGILAIPAPHGGMLKIDCTLLRCREAVEGWFEGSMYFNREQGAFEVEMTQAGAT